MSLKRGESRGEARLRSWGTESVRDSVCVFVVLIPGSFGGGPTQTRRPVGQGNAGRRPELSMRLIENR